MKQDEEKGKTTGAKKKKKREITGEMGGRKGRMV